MSRRIYLDHHATTPCDPRVVDAMVPWFTEHPGNPASPHVFGWEARDAIQQASVHLATALGAEDREVVYTSGATESIALALRGRAGITGPGHFVSTTIEHPAVLENLRRLEREGHRVTLVSCDGNGLVDPDAVEAALEPDTILCSVMWANNEIGTLQPIEEIVRRCHARGIPVHSDACQAVGRVDVDLHGSGVDLLTVSGHKIYGPKGIGALLVRRQRPRLRLEPQLVGGGQQGGLRSGTLPVPLIVGLGEAARLATETLERESRRLRTLRDRLLERLRERAAPVIVHGSLEARLCNNLSVAFPGVEAEAILLDQPGLGLSVGSACSASHAEPSHVLLALGLDREIVHSTLRIGLGRGNTEDQIEEAADRIATTVRRLRRETPTHASFKGAVAWGPRAATPQEPARAQQARIRPGGPS